MSNIECRPGALSRGTLAAVAALSAALLIASLLAASADATDPAARPGRDGVWRAIFARPKAAAAHSPALAARIALGRDLFHDPRLSGSGKASCATCHDPARAFTDGRKTGHGPAGDILARNVPALYDLAWGKAYFWDGRAPTLEAQARVPILATDEMAGDFAVITRILSADEDFAARFSGAYPAAKSRGVTEDMVVGALAAYVRSLASPPSRFDAWVAGDDAVLDAEEQEGFRIFVGKGGCVSCHGGWRLTDDGFHDVGLPGSDKGRDGRPEFKTPSLREAANTPPYMHDGSLATLADVVDHYADGVIRRPSLAPTLVQDLDLSAAEKSALVAFLKTLSSEKAVRERVISDETTRPMIEK